MYEKTPLDTTIKVVTHNSISNFIKPTDKPSSEKAFEKAITVLFNQTLEGTIATVFLNLYGRKNIVDMLNPDTLSSLISSDSHLVKLIPNRSERDLIITLHLCNREFFEFYESKIHED